jgi:hypothetical protein
MTVSKPGLYPEITPAEYFAGFTPARALTSTGIKKLLATTAADYRYGEDEGSAAKRLGDVVHQLALGKGAGYAVSDHKRWDDRDKDYAAFRAECERQGLTPIKRKDFEAAEEMADILYEQICVALGCMDDAAYLTEVPFAWVEETPYGPVWCTGMMDVWCADRLTVIDPKVTAQVHAGPRHAVSMGWDIQAAWYLRGLSKIMPHHAGRLTFKNLLVSDKPPHTTRLIRYSEGWRTNAERECERALHLFARCLHANEWPAYPPEETWDEPGWSQAQRLQHELEDAS